MKLKESIQSRERQRVEERAKTDAMVKQVLKQQPLHKEIEKRYLS